MIEIENLKFYTYKEKKPPRNHACYVILSNQDRGIGTGQVLRLTSYLSNTRVKKLAWITSKGSIIREPEDGDKWALIEESAYELEVKSNRYTDNKVILSKIVDKIEKQR